MIPIELFCSIYPKTLQSVNINQVFCFDIIQCDKVVFKQKDVELPEKREKGKKRKKKKKKEKKFSGEEIFVKAGYSTGEILPFKKVCRGD